LFFAENRNIQKSKHTSHKINHNSRGQQHKKREIKINIRKRVKEGHYITNKCLLKSSKAKQIPTVLYYLTRNGKLFKCDFRISFKKTEKVYSIKNDKVTPLCQKENDAGFCIRVSVYRQLFYYSDCC